MGYQARLQAPDREYATIMDGCHARNLGRNSKREFIAALGACPRIRTASFDYSDTRS